MGNTESQPVDPKAAYKAHSFPGSSIVDSLTAPCGSLKDTVDGNSPTHPHGLSRILNQAESLCVQSPSSDAGNKGVSRFDDEYEDFRKDRERLDDDDDDSITRQDRYRPPPSPANPTSALFARALISEVTDNPKTMRPSAMAEREMKLLKAQQRARLAKKTGDQSRPVGVPGGVGNPSVLGSLAHALTGTTDPLAAAQAQAKGIKASVMPPNSMSENRAQVDSNVANGELVPGKHTITIGLSLSRRSSVGHPDTVTRQTAFDFNELQDREYKYVSSTDSTGWRAGGGERGGAQSPMNASSTGAPDGSDDGDFGVNVKPLSTGAGTPTGAAHKTAAPDTVHIPIIHIDAESPQAIDMIIAALARGEIFIPHMAVMPESLSVDGVSPPDLVVRFGTERNEDLPPDEWPNWCLEFMHNQLYEYFYGMGARWMKRPFSITLARKVRWKTVKHMNRYFAHAERVIDAWREKGPQHLDPQLTYIEGGATPEEVARPHGIYLSRNGVPTNYFAPNFDPPYTTKMTRSLLLNVLGKSWDKKRREWTSEPIPRLVTPGMLMTAMCGCGDNNAGGFIATEVTLKNKIDTSSIPREAVIRSADPGSMKKTSQPSKHPPQQQSSQQQQQQQQSSQRHPPETPAGTEAADTDIMSEPVGQTTPSHLTNNKSNNNNIKERKPVDPTLGLEQEEHFSSTANESTPRSFQKLDLHVSSSSADQESNVSSSILSPKYGMAPTPENLISPQSLTGGPKDRYMLPDTPNAVEGTNVADVSMDTGTSDFVQPSVTNTNSTVMHMNLSGDTFMKRELVRRVAREEKKEDPDILASDEDWFDSLVSHSLGTTPLTCTCTGGLRSSTHILNSSPSQGEPLASPAVAGLGAQTTTREKDKVKEALEKERARQIALLARAQEQTEGQENLHKAMNNESGNSDYARGMMKYEKNSKRSLTNPKDPVSINKNNSGVSLDYSLDSTSFIGDGSTIGGSSLLGGNFVGDGSVATASTKGTWSNSVQKKDPLALSANEALTNARDDDEVSGFSLQESSSSMEVVPTDEELFALGWAKAMDPKSGSYYYFTLDRTKIVWENPLASRGASADSGESGSLPDGAVVI